jgi:hypothetical protein
LANGAGAVAPQQTRGRPARSAKHDAKAAGHAVLAFAADAPDESNFTRF